MPEQIYNFMNEQVKVGDQGNVISATPITSSTVNPNGSLSSVVTSSTGTQNNINNLNTAITDAQNKSFNIDDFMQKYVTNIDTSATDTALTKSLLDRQTQLEKRRSDEIARLTAGYQTDKAIMENRQVKDLEPLNAKLSAIGDAQYGPDALYAEQLKIQKDKIIQANKLELQQLYNQREGFIAQARNAYEDADYALAESQLKLAKESQKQLYDRQKDLVSMALKFAQENRAQATYNLNVMKEKNDQEQSRLKTLADQGITGNFYKYSGSDSVYSSQNPGVVLTPEQYKQMSEVGNFSDVQVVSSKAESDYVSDLARTYADTVFPTMTAEQAQKAMQYSKIYQDKIRGPINKDTSGSYKFSTDDSGKLLALGLTRNEISTIQTNLNNGVDINTILDASSLSNEEKKGVKNVMSGITATQFQNTGQFLSEQWFKDYYSEKALEDAAKQAGFMINIKMGRDKPDIDSYIKAKMKEINRDRSAGMTDTEIYSKNLSK